MQWIALAGVVAGCLWLIVVAWLMWSRPQDCLRWLAMFASTWRINVTELGLRALLGLCIILRAPFSKAPAVFDVMGWFLLVTAVLLLATPRRWHNAYAVWWAQRLPVWLVRWLVPLTAAAGLSLAYFAM